MQVWKHVQKQLQGNRREQQAPEQSRYSPFSSLQFSGFVKQQTPSSVFYFQADYDDDVGETVTKMSVPGLNSMDRNSDTILGSDDVIPGSAKFAKTPSLPKSSRVKKLPPAVPPPPPPAQRKPQQPKVADSAVNDGKRQDSEKQDGKKQTAGLVMCQRGTLFPPERTPQASESARRTPPSGAKPTPAVCFCFIEHSGSSLMGHGGQLVSKSGCLQFNAATLLNLLKLGRV